MDSVSSSLPRDGSTAAVGTLGDEAAFSVTAGLAKEAALLFQAGKFVDCLGILNRLLQKKDDPRVRHNIIIAENVGDGCSDPKKLTEDLENIKAVVWFHLHDYEKSFSYLDSLYQNIEPLDEGTALRICLLLVDNALLSHHASRSADVISYMEKVFCINSLTNLGENGRSAHHQSLSISKPASLPSNSILSDSSHVDSVANANTLLEYSLTRTSSEEALEDQSLQLLSSLDISGQNLQGPGVAGFNDLSRSQTEESSSVADLRLKLHLFKVRFFLLTRNLKAAKREVKIAMNLARGKDYPMALYLKSQLEYARRNHRKAIKLLMASSNCAETGFPSMYYNNLGCIYHQLGKHHTSGVFFTKALKNSSHARKEKPPKLLTLSYDKSLLISYNCGAHYLACGKPFHAVKCFQKASLIFYNRPLLWLRVAECCLMALGKGLIKPNSPAFDKSDIRAKVIGKGKWRQLALNYGVSPNGQCEYFGEDELIPDEDMQSDLSMSLARQCLVNALYLLDFSAERCFRLGSSPTGENESTEKIVSADQKPVTGDPKESSLASNTVQPNSNGEMKEEKSVNSQSAVLQNSITDYECNCVSENQMIRQAALADLAYVELALGNPLKALSVAKSLSNIPDCSRVYIFLATMYISEALCMLNQPEEAAEHLMRYISGGNNVELPYDWEDYGKWEVHKMADNEDPNADESQGYVFPSPEVARGFFCANYAANLALLGEFDEAHHFVMEALSAIPSSPHAIITGIYLDLKHGKTQAAIAKLKHHSAVRFLPGILGMTNGTS
ncbi:uncharacterized protein LOC127258798 isoform X2 [Andrographis paniculata]|uniref:uncharacterized protein LOC127258798 isoform X2 n=1 Tax=Andrographis paniculata TaxID=175694 RepID=UPI0021E91893|nr:uncharacterized protein LOC127258798 isoform X2 [Andrographis paniculata]